MKKAFLTALVVAALAGTANAQVRLELRLVRQTGTPANPGASNPVTDVDSNSSVTAVAGTTLRFELQYRLLNLVGDANHDGVDDDGILPDGFSAGTIDIRSGNGTLDRAQLSQFEHSNSDATIAPTSPDTSGVGFGGASSRRGLHAPYRGGLSDQNNNDLPSNGLVNVDSNPDPNLYHPGAGNTLLSPTPVAISNTHQGNPYFYAPGPDGLPDFSHDQTWFGLYSFTFTVGSSNTDITAAAQRDQVTGGAFGYFLDSNSVPQAGNDAVGATYHIVVPAPGAVALLGLGGLVGLRRRRA